MSVSGLSNNYDYQMATAMAAQESMLLSGVGSAATVDPTNGLANQETQILDALSSGQVSTAGGVDMYI